ncbi:MAG: L-threonylcarbamoyladenylate synthase [Acidimicrobiales bacterium]
MIDVRRAPVHAVVDKAATALRAGDVVALPTETVYGLAALPSIPGATRRLFELKGRGPEVPVAVLCADAGQALALAESPTKRVVAVAERCWPGPLTLVLRRRAGLGYELGEPATTIGLRCPDHALVQAVAAEVGPIATTSANRHGEPTPVDATGVAAVFDDGVALVLDGGRCTGAPSTVIDATGVPWKILRQGALPVDLG